MNDSIKAFWDSKAGEFKEKCGDDMGNTLKDKNLRRLEIQAIMKHLADGTDVLDIGCGNGFSTVTFAEAYAMNIHGMDFSAEMIKNAGDLLKKRMTTVKGAVAFFQGDILDEHSITGLYDVIITERCLINLGTWENQKKAIRNIHRHLKDGGLFLMLEGFIDNLKDLNKVREKFRLQPIEVVWHNLFFERDRFVAFITDLFEIEKKDNYGSTYMLLSRSYLHAIQEEKAFDETLDYLATLLPDLGDYNYQQLYVLRKK